MSRTKRRERARGQILARGLNRYLLRVYLGRGAEGKRRYSAKTMRGTYKSAERELTKMLGQVDAHTYVEPAKSTLAEYLDSWLQTSAKGSVADKTHSDYARLLRRHVYPPIGCRRLDRVTSLDIQGAYAAMTAKGLSPRTVQYTHMILNQALNRAVEWGFLFRNPGQFVSLPKQQRKEMQHLTAAQTSTLVSAAHSDPLYALWVVLLFSGVRIGEALALQWSDVEGDRLRIRRTLVRNSDYSLGFNEPKTAKSRRTVTLPGLATSALQQHRSSQLRSILAAGNAYDRQDLIFANSMGGPLFHERIRRRWRKLLQKAGLPQVRLYDTRHTHASLLLAAGVNPKVVSERLGHSSIVLTLNTYTHVIPELDQQAATTLETLILKHGSSR